MTRFTFAHHFDSDQGPTICQRCGMGWMSDDPPATGCVPIPGQTLVYSPEAGEQLLVEEVSFPEGRRIGTLVLTDCLSLTALHTVEASPNAIYSAARLAEYRRNKETTS